MAGEWVEVVQSGSVEQTKQAAAVLAGLFGPGDVVTLDGDLGAGKTQFTQGLAVALGVSGSVTSPTFNLMVAYTDGRIPLYHFDLYRLDDPSQLDDLAFYEYIEGDGVACVEWANKFADDMPDDRLEVRLSVAGEEARRIEACAWGNRAAALLDGWVAALA